MGSCQEILLAHCLQVIGLIRLDTKNKMTEARRQKQCLHNRACKEKTPLYVGKTQTMAWQRAGLGNKGRMALSTPHTCVPYILCPQQPVTTWAKTVNYKYWERAHTYLKSTAPWRAGIRHSHITQTSSSIMLLITRAQSISQTDQVSPFFHWRETRASEQQCVQLTPRLASPIPSSFLRPSYKVCVPLLKPRWIYIFLLT